MHFKIESVYTYGWDDAGWTEETDSVTRPLRFETSRSAQEALNTFFTDVKTAVAAGNMDNEENQNHYRIVMVK